MTEQEALKLYEQLCQYAPFKARIDQLLQTELQMRLIEDTWDQWLGTYAHLSAICDLIPQYIVDMGDKEREGE